MEETPWTKSEFFAWNDGRRIVDLNELSNQLQCKQCNSVLDLRRTERESRYGLASVLYVLCNCGVMNDVHTGKMQYGGDANLPNPMYEVNIKASINLLMYGAGASHILSFLALLDIPVPPPDDPSRIMPVKEDRDPARPQSDIVPSALPPTSSTSAALRPVHQDKTPSLQNSSPSSRVCGSNSMFRSVPFPPPPPSPLPLSSGQNHDRDDSSGDDVDDNCNDSDDALPLTDNHSDDALPLTDNQNLEELSDNQNDNAKTHQRQGNNINNDSANNNQVIEDEEEEDEEEEEVYVPPVKIKVKATRGSKKSSVRGSRKVGTKACTREPLKLVVQRIPQTRAKVKREEPPVETVIDNSGEEHQEENNKVDYSNTMDWSSTESEPEAEESQDRDSDVSWQEEKEEEKPKRGRGRPKGSTDKVKRTRRSGPYKREQDTSAVKEEPVSDEDNQVPRCNTCAKNFNSVKGYNLHMKRVHNQEAKGPSLAPEGHWQVIQEEVTGELFRCPLCGSVFAEPRRFFSHCNRYHPALERDEKGNRKLYSVPLKDSVSKRRIVYENGAEVVYYQCCKCCCVFTSPYLLGEHLRVNIEGQLSCVTFSRDGAKIRDKTVEVLFCKKVGKETSCLCSNCGKVYADRVRLQAHVKHMHTEKRFSCNICNASFTQPTFLRYHMQTHDKNRTKSHICQTCGNRFYNVNGLNRHIKDQHMSSKLFSCPICGKVFSSSNARNSHVILHTGRRSYSCSECSKTFNKRSNLVVHKRIHSGIKPYNCSVCREAFAQKNSLNCHMKKHGLNIKQHRKCLNADLVASASATASLCEQINPHLLIGPKDKIMVGDTSDNT